MVDISTDGILSVPKKVGVGSISPRVFRIYVPFGIGALLVVEQSTLEIRPRGVIHTSPAVYGKCYSYSHRRMRVSLPTDK